jgi:hypothetical protein
VSGVPGGDLVAPPHDGAAELANLGRARVVLEIGAEPGREVEGEVGVVVVVDGAHDLIGVPRGAHLAPGITGIQQAQQPAAAPVVQTLIGAHMRVALVSTGAPEARTV